MLKTCEKDHHVHVCSSWARTQCNNSWRPRLWLFGNLLRSSSSYMISPFGYRECQEGLLTKCATMLITWNETNYIRGRTPFTTYHQNPPKQANYKPEIRLISTYLRTPAPFEANSTIFKLTHRMQWLDIHGPLMSRSEENKIWNGAFAEAISVSAGPGSFRTLVSLPSSNGQQYLQYGCTEILMTNAAIFETLVYLGLSTKSSEIPGPRIRGSIHYLEPAVTFRPSSKRAPYDIVQA